MYYTASTKVRKHTGTSRPASPFKVNKRRQPGSSKSKKKADAVATEEDDFLSSADVGIEDSGAIRRRLAPSLQSTRVVDVLAYVPAHMFMGVPERASGMNSVRIAEVLNYRLRLPPIVSVAHVHALSASPTNTEREIARLVHSGAVRKVSIPGRGTGGAAVGDGLVQVSAWERVVQTDSGLEDEIKTKYVIHLKGQADAAPFTANEIRLLSQRGYLTGSNAGRIVSDTVLRPGSASLGSLQTVANAGSYHASGSDGAVASSAVQHISGGTGSVPRTSSGSTGTVSYAFSLPNTGPYLKLLISSRDHLLTILAKSGPHRSMPLDRLKERWEGGAADTDSEKFERKGVAPGKTVKWRRFNGLEFEWVLGECLGAGMVECFNTGSVGMGVRAI